MNDNQNLYKTNRLLVYGTWALVAVTIIIGLLTCDKMGNQVDEMKRATELEWRPFLNIKINGSHQEFYYCLNDSINMSDEWRDLKNINIDTDEYKAVRWLIVENYVSREYWNSGKTPLRITYDRVKSISQEMWLNTFKKDASALMRYVSKLPDDDSCDTDVVILPGDSIRIPNDTLNSSMKKTGMYGINIKDYEKYRDIDGEMYIYPYVYTEYEDFFGHKYNAIIICLLKYKFNETDGIITPALEFPTIEVYDWDVAY